MSSTHWFRVTWAVPVCIPYPNENTESVKRYIIQQTNRDSCLTYRVSVWIRVTNSVSPIQCLREDKGLNLWLWEPEEILKKSTKFSWIHTHCGGKSTLLQYPEGFVSGFQNFSVNSTASQRAHCKFQIGCPQNAILKYEMANHFGKLASFADCDWTFEMHFLGTINLKFTCNTVVSR